ASVTNDAPATFPLGETTVTWIVTDNAGLTATCTQTVTVNDTTPPTITCPTDVVISADASCIATSVALGAPTTADNCGVASVTNDAPATFPLGETTVTWIVTDNTGLTATCTQTVTVNDTTPPTITCPTDVVISADASCIATSVALGAPTTADNCGVASVTNDAPATFPLGETTVTWTVTDNAGLTATCTQTVTVNDTMPPTITCPTNLVISTDTSCEATSVALGTPTTVDNCGVASVTNDAPATFPLGETTVTWTVTDNTGLTATCTQTVTVNDTTPPTITCPADVVISADASCVVTSVTLGAPTTADNCGVASVTNDAPATFPLGETTVTWIVTDNAGLTATCTQTVTVNDTTPPTITCPTDVVISADASCIATSVALGAPTTADNCGVASVTNDAPATFPLGETTVTWIVTDNTGLTATCTQTVTVNDTTPPTITCPTDVVISADASCIATSVALGAPTTADNCGVASVTNDAPATFPLGETTVTWT
ncbi:HYR domain-containing protein, partial [Oceanihabitans sediminis]